MHEHFDADGELTGYTVVWTESLWDNSARARATKLVEFEDSIDPHTNLPVDVAYGGQDFVVDHQVNFAEIALDQHKRKVKADAAKEAKLAGGKLADNWDLGFHYHVRPATAAEIAEGEAQRAH